MIAPANGQSRAPRRDQGPTRRSPMLGAIVALLPITVADCGALLQSGHSTAMVRDQYLGKGAAAGRAAAKARQTARNAMKLRQAARAQAVQAPSSEFKAA